MPKPDVWVVYVTENDEGTFDVYVDGRDEYEALGLSYGDAYNRAEEILSNMKGGGHIITERKDEKARLDEV